MSTRHTPASVRPVVLTAAIGLTFVAGLSRPNAARPDLHGSWPLEGLLPFTLGPAVTTGVLWSAIALGVVAVMLGLAARAPAMSWRWPIGLGVLSLLVTPMGSGDHLNYAAYGRILLMGGDPWTESPSAWAGGHDPIASAVEEPWTTEPSVYGPFVTLLQAGSAAVGGSQLRLVVLAWQVVVVVAWLGVRAGLRAILDRERHGRIDVLWTLNPLVLGVALLGAHVDTVATALCVAAVVALARRPGPAGIVLAGVFTGLAAGSKFTYAVIGVAIVLTWTVVGPDCWSTADASRARRWVRLVPGCLARIGWLLLGTLSTVALLHSWTGPHVYDQVGRARSSVSLASPWRLVLAHLGGALGGGTTRSLISVGAMVLAITLAVLLLRRLGSVSAETEMAQSILATSNSATFNPATSNPATSNPATAILVTTAALSMAYSLAAPYTLPWYDLLAWAALPAVLPSVVDRLLLARLAIMAAAYVPGRVLGMTPGVESVTLGFRRGVAPWLQLAVWVVTVILLGRGTVEFFRPGGVRDGSGRSSATGRPGP